MIVQLRTADHRSDIDQYLDINKYRTTEMYVDPNDEDSYSKRIHIAEFDSFDEMVESIKYNRILIDEINRDMWDVFDHAEYMVTIADDYLS